MREAFELAARGWGLTRIAKSFRDRGIKSPSRITEDGRARREQRNLARIEAGLAPLPAIVERWTTDGVRELLHRELYRGVIVRGRVKRSRRGGSKIRVAVPEEQWKRRADESARIVSDELSRSGRGSSSGRPRARASSEAPCGRGLSRRSSRTRKTRRRWSSAGQRLRSSGRPWPPWRAAGRPAAFPCRPRLA